MGSSRQGTPGSDPGWVCWHENRLQPRKWPSRKTEPPPAGARRVLSARAEWDRGAHRVSLRPGAGARAGLRRAVKERVHPPCPTLARRHRSKDAGKPSAPRRLLSLVQGGVHRSQSKHLTDGGSLTLPGKLPRVGSSSAPMGSGRWRVVLPSPQAPAFSAEANSGTTLTPRLGSCQKSHEAPLPAPPPGSSGRGPGRLCAATRQWPTKGPFVRILLCANHAARRGGGEGVTERLGARAVPLQPGLEQGPQSHPRLGEQTCLVHLSGAGASDVADPNPQTRRPSPAPTLPCQVLPTPPPVLDLNRGQQTVPPFRMAYPLSTSARGPRLTLGKTSGGARSTGGGSKSRPGPQCCRILVSWSRRTDLGATKG